MNLARRFTCLLLIAASHLVAFSQAEPATGPAEKSTATVKPDSKQVDAEADKKAAEWTAALSLDDPAKASRVQAVISAHLKSVRSWHMEHPTTTVPADTHPITGKPLSTLEREIIADSAMPKSVHTDLMTGLRRDLNEAQVETILDKYTVGKVAFTLAGYHAIVPDLTKEEETTILGYLKQAREEAVDYKNMKEISAIFEIYKTKSEQYLNANGRNWKALYQAYSAAAKAKKNAPKQNP